MRFPNEGDQRVAVLLRCGEVVNCELCGAAVRIVGAGTTKFAIDQEGTAAYEPVATRERIAEVRGQVETALRAVAALDMCGDEGLDLAHGFIAKALGRAMHRLDEMLQADS